MRSLKRLFVVIACVLLINGCATAPAPVVPPITGGTQGVYHKVEKGETLWKVSRMYNIDLEDLTRANRISDVSNVEVGQLLFIPSRHKLIPAPAPDTTSSADFIWPLKGRVVAEFGEVLANMVNKGINIQPYSSSADVIASRSGRVVFYSPDFEVYGKTVILDHGDGFLTVYARNAKVFVKPGDEVLKGAVIATTGFAGRNKNVYLHFQIRKGHVPQNPRFYLP